MDNAYEKENQEIHKVSPFSSAYNERWKHGTFHQGEDLSKDGTLPREYGRHKITDLDNGTSESVSPERRYESPKQYSGSTDNIHRRGVLEEINSDEFFLRQKGISQDNIEVGAYLSSEIREAFKNPGIYAKQSHLTDKSHDLTSRSQEMSDQSHDIQLPDPMYKSEKTDQSPDFGTSDQSASSSPKRKPIRKPKRKKTPHTSDEKLSYDGESILTEPEEFLKTYDKPVRPQRRSKKKKQVKEEIIPYQETIPVDQEYPHPYDQESIENVQLRKRYYEDDESKVYENEKMEGIEQPEIMVSDPYHREFYKKIDIGFIDEDSNGMPEAPPRKQRSLKSLTNSEPDSILGEFVSSFQDYPLHNVSKFYYHIFFSMLFLIKKSMLDQCVSNYGLRMSK